MATKPRHLKTPLQLWVVDNRKRLGETPADLARLTGVTIDTARGWESRGGPSEDALEILERHFGVPRPTQRTAAPDVGTAVVQEIRELREALVSAIRDRDSAIEALIRANTDLLAELRVYRQQTVERQTVERSLLEALPAALAAALGARREGDRVGGPR